MSHSVTPPRRNWPWVVAVIAAVAVIVVGASVVSALIGDGEGEPAAVPTQPAPVASVASPSATSTPVESPTASPSSTAIDDDDIAIIEDSVATDTPIGLYDYLGDPVHVTFAASDFDSDRTPDLAITDLEYVAGATGWNWQLDDATLAAYRAGRYANYFPDDAVIGQSAESYVIALTITDDTITRIFVSKSASILTAP